MRKSLPAYKRDSYIDRICDYLVAPSKPPSEILSPEDCEKLQRMEFAHRQLSRNLNKRQVVEMLIKQFITKRGNPISEHDAYRIINDTILVYGAVAKVDKQYYKTIVIDMIMDTFRMAKEKGDLRAMNSAAANLVKAAGIDKEDSKSLPADILDRVVVMLQVNPTLLGVQPVDMTEVEALLAEVTKPNRVIDITDKQ